MNYHTGIIRGYYTGIIRGLYGDYTGIIQGLYGESPPAKYNITRGDANVVRIDKSAHVHHKDFGMRTETLYIGWAGRTKTVRKGFVGAVPQNVMCKGSIGPTKAAYKVWILPTQSSCAQRLCLHQVFVDTKPSCAPPSLHTDNPNGYTEVVLNNRIAMHTIDYNKRSVTYTWTHRQTNGHGILLKGRIFRMNVQCTLCSTCMHTTCVCTCMHIRWK